MKKGFTIVELMVVIVIMAILGAVVFGRMGMGGGSKEEAMQSYVAFIEPSAQNIRVRCQDWDSDGDGYTRCTAAFIVNGKSQSAAAECPGMMSWNSDCVEVKGRGFFR